MLDTENTTVVLAKMMEFARQKQEVTAHNLANANTPGYIRQKLDFEDAMKAASPEEVKDVTAQRVDDFSNAKRLDGNNVKSSQELNDMMQNSIFFQLSAKAMSTKMSILKAAMSSR